MINTTFRLNNMGVAFTKRITDRSSAIGFEFQFFCDSSAGLSIDLKEPKLIKTSSNCSYSYLSSFQPNAAGAVARVMQAANILIQSARKDNLAAAGEAISMVQRDKYWDEALVKAVEEAKPHFRHCPRCSRWVCAQNCWNEESQQCIVCLTTPPGSELSFAKAQKFFSKVWENVQSVVDIPGITDLPEKNATCAHCGEKTGGGSFCPMCGKATTPPAKFRCFCGNCGEELNNTDLKFCPNCGKSVNEST